MKYWIINIGLILYCLSLYTQNNVDKIIIWSENYKLKWDDFQGEVQNNTKADAVSGTRICRNFNYDFKNHTIKISTEAIFLKKKSWVKDSNNASTLLEHEQIHFDITELYARKFRKAILETKFKKNGKKAEKKFYRVYDKIYKEKDAYQSLYDKETKHSRDKVKQKEWAEKVAKELAELEEYANPKIVIDLNKKRKKK